MEIERKYLVSSLPKNLDSYKHKHIIQGYISIDPVIRIRKQNEEYILTIKGQGLLTREEHELIITKEQFQKLSPKVEGTIIDKIRYYIPYKHYIIELDVYNNKHEGLFTAEVEFNSLEESFNFVPPTWFGKDVTEDSKYQNSQLSV